MARYNILLIFLCVFIGFSVCIPASNDNQIGQRGVQGSILFLEPSNDENVLQQFNPINSKPCEGNSTYCEKIDNYPGNEIKNILMAAGTEFSQFFGQDILPPPEDSLRSFHDESQLCASVEHLIYPQAAINQDNKWLHIANQVPFTQGVRVEVCQKSGSSCLLAESFPHGYESFCVQRYVFKKLVAIDDKGRPVTDYFPIPSCCSCSVRNVS